MLNDYGAAFVTVDGLLLQQGIRYRAGSPNECLGRDFKFRRFRLFALESYATGTGDGKAGVQLESDAAGAHPFERVIRERGVELRENAVARVDEDDAQFLRR